MAITTTYHIPYFMNADLQINDDIRLPAALLQITATRSSGPGGQHVNKVATRIDLRFDLENAFPFLDPEVIVRLRSLAQNKRDANGRIIITDQSSRSQAENAERARTKLKNLILKALTPPKERKVPLDLPKAVKATRRRAKAKNSGKKQQRSFVLPHDFEDDSI